MLPLNPYTRHARLSLLSNRYYTKVGFYPLKVIPVFNKAISIDVPRFNAVGTKKYKEKVLKKLLEQFDITLDIFNLDSGSNDPVDSIPMVMVGNKIKFAHGFYLGPNYLAIHKLISKVDGSVASIDRIYSILRAKPLSDLQGIPECKNISIGFDKKTNKWCGWTHRGIACYGIGDKVTEDDIAYRPDSSSALMARIRKTYSELYNVPISCMDRVSYKDYIEVILNEKINPFDPIPSSKFGVSVCFEFKGSKMNRFHPYPDRWGKGEWTALSMDDAKQMACDAVIGLA